MPEINLPIVIGASLIDSINPCAFGVLIFLLTYLAASVRRKIHMLINGLIYIFGVFITYFAAGLLLLPIIQELGAFSVASYLVIAAIVIIAGLLEITAFFLGCFVAIVELPCTGAVYLAVLALMSLSGITMSNISFLVIYNVIFVLPLLIILYIVYKGISTEKLENWRQKHKGLMRLSIGLILISLGIWMVYTVI